MVNPERPFFLENNMIRYELRFCRNIPKKAIEEYFDEFDRFGEYCNVLWRLYDVSVDEWLKEIYADNSTMYVGFCVNDKLVGMARVTPHPNHIENGKFGFAIRPTCRGRLLAPTMIRLVEDYCNWIGLKDVTACVYSANVKSLNAFERAGWKETGNVYQWTGDRLAIELTPKKL